jgi:hypothetical protein
LNIVASKSGDFAERVKYIANNKLIDINNSVQQSTKNAILSADPGFIQKYVAAVDKNTGELKFLKLGESF